MKILRQLLRHSLLELKSLYAFKLWLHLWCISTQADKYGKAIVTPSSYSMKIKRTFTSCSASASITAGFMSKKERERKKQSQTLTKWKKRNLLGTFFNITHWKQPTMQLSLTQQIRGTHHWNPTHSLSFGLVQHESFLPLAVGSLVGLANVEFLLGAVLALHGLPLVQGHLLGSFLFDLTGLVFPVWRVTHTNWSAWRSNLLTGHRCYWATERLFLSVWPAGIPLLTPALSTPVLSI